MFTLVHAISIRRGGDSKNLIAGGPIYCSLLYLLQKNNWGTLYIFDSLYVLIDDCSHCSLFIVTNLSPLSWEHNYYAFKLTLFTGMQHPPPCLHVRQKTRHQRHLILQQHPLLPQQNLSTTTTQP